MIQKVWTNNKYCIDKMKLPNKDTLLGKVAMISSISKLAAIPHHNYPF